MDTSTIIIEYYKWTHHYNIQAQQAFVPKPTHPTCLATGSQMSNPYYTHQAWHRFKHNSSFVRSIDKKLSIHLLNVHNNDTP